MWLRSVLTNAGNKIAKVTSRTAVMYIMAAYLSGCTAMSFFGITEKSLLIIIAFSSQHFSSL